ncbi:MAG: GFA family protein [Pseudomonadota bacterium]
MSDAPVWREGGCHCGAVRFEVCAPARIRVEDCNCSICAMTGFLHLIVPASRFRLTRGQDMLTTYRFNSGEAEHWFCRVCGVKSFYRPRSNLDGYSVNLRCLDEADFEDIDVRPFDGRNWEANAAALRGLTRGE